MTFFKRHALLVLLTACVVSLAANALTLRVAFQYFRQLNGLRLDPNERAFYATAAPPALAPGERRVVFFGDSRSLMWTPPEGLPRVQFVNRGIGYQTTAQVLGRFDAEMPPLDPDVIVLQVGINDLKTIALFPEREREIVQSVERNLDALVARARRLGAEVILVTVFPVGPVDFWRKPLWSVRVKPAVDRVNAHLATLAGPGVRLLPADRVLLDAEGRLRAEFAVDHLHLTPSAYHALNQKSLIPLLVAGAR